MLAPCIFSRQEACNLFYTRVPHDFGMRRPPTIATIAEVKEKHRLLELLGDIKLTMTMLKEEDTSIHPDDRNFKQLDTGLKPLPAKSKERQMIKDYSTARQPNPCFHIFIRHRTPNPVFEFIDAFATIARLCRRPTVDIMSRLSPICHP